MKIRNYGLNQTLARPLPLAIENKRCQYEAESSELFFAGVMEANLMRLGIWRERPFWWTSRLSLSEEAGAETNHAGHADLDICQKKTRPAKHGKLTCLAGRAIGICGHERLFLVA